MLEVYLGGMVLLTVLLLLAQIFVLNGEDVSVIGFSIPFWPVILPLFLLILFLEREQK